MEISGLPVVGARVWVRSRCPAWYTRYFVQDLSKASSNQSLAMNTTTVAICLATGNATSNSSHLHKPSHSKCQRRSTLIGLPRPSTPKAKTLFTPTAWSVVLDRTRGMEKHGSDSASTCAAELRRPAICPFLPVVVPSLLSRWRLVLNPRITHRQFDWRTRIA
ncbi:hypothetical protein BDP55DRAFT_321306 [Colletotrichum godetiae]|uniref:Uncharacterized protein n=1 Tax=Colletotrichum godetiae TaxID=1209918 RepID=A0AAJ0AD33_9PEZI|nr:uncharacterized protein BDP55DRAFT_321306 [Colletotrichum godetiae]KAK1671024.1 hypothetical protein BDP55DRAFT_321306 [Colletotrichum godetiae]